MSRVPASAYKWTSSLGGCRSTNELRPQWNRDQWRCEAGGKGVGLLTGCRMFQKVLLGFLEYSIHLGENVMPECLVA